MPNLMKTPSAANLKPSETGRARAGSRNDKMKGSESLTNLGKKGAAAGGAEGETDPSSALDTKGTETSQIVEQAASKPAEP